MKGIRAVVVDDNHLNRKLVARTLEGRGIQTNSAEDAGNGWKIIQMLSPQLIVLDIMLPGAMDGVALCRMVRGDPRFHNAVVVMVTAADKRREAERSLAAGADILIPKPFSPKEFWLHVEPLLQRKLLQPLISKVFILEDDENDAKLAEQVLLSAGYQVLVQTASSGALSAIKTFRPDFILLDVMVPGLSGNELAKIINREKSLNCKPKILFYSNKSREELQILVQETGVEGYILKTDGPSAILLALTRLHQQA